MFVPEDADHKEWLGYLQPVGLVVAPLALVRGQAVVNRNVSALQQCLLQHVERQPDTGELAGRIAIKDFSHFAQNILEWMPADLLRVADHPDILASVEVMLVDYNETLCPTYVVPDVSGGSEEDKRSFLMLIVECPVGTDLDAETKEPHRWHGSPQARMERLLRETSHDIGLIVNGTDIRLVYAPRGETSGHLTFPVDAMCEVQGRLILGAFRMLLEADRIFDTLPPERRLPALLQQSRQYQNEVSTLLAGQVLQALDALLQGFQTAHAADGAKLLYTGTSEQRQHIYGGLLTTLMRLVFLLYAEDRGLMPDHDVYAEHYSVSGLFEQLRADVGMYPDTMDQRYGAWVRLLSLFRLVYHGGKHLDLQVPQRHGQLFDPNEYPFLEGRQPHDIGADRLTSRLEPPKVSDGVVYRVLSRLLVVNGERLSYRSLDVEQIGSVYEAMMGFSVEVATGPSVAVRPHHVMVDLTDLLNTPSADRAKTLKQGADCALTGQPLTALQQAQTPDDIFAALGKKVSDRTPTMMPAGSMFLQPGEERRKTGSHYTPRSLTEPIVRTTLQPVLQNLGPNPTPAQILDLKICDPAMGSGALLVETCRQLAEQLVRAWEFHRNMPDIPKDEDPLLHARRLIAQRCLYGVDKNPFAVHLAKLSLWLVTLARDHAFTFLDHALRSGDSIVGLSLAQITNFALQTKSGDQLSFDEYLHSQVANAVLCRQRIHDLGDTEDLQKKQAWRESEDILAEVRLIGDLFLHTFFSADKPKGREQLRKDMLAKLRSSRQQDPPLSDIRSYAQEIREWPHPIYPFHWEVEFPEVFQRSNPGFDAFVGNPPFVGGYKISSTWGAAYLDWLKEYFPESGGQADIVAYFFRHTFHLLRQDGAIGLIATNTIAQGDTRATGLRWICNHGGQIYHATKRYKWPGMAAVVVSVVHIKKGHFQETKILNGKKVPDITAFLFYDGGHDNPKPLSQHVRRSFTGSKIYGQGFTFDDTDKNGVANPIAEMHCLIAKDPRNAERIFPYIGGAEINDSPTHAHHRYVINFADMSEEQARQWPDLMKIVEEKVKPERMKLKDNADGRKLKEYWWLFGRTRPEMNAAIAGLKRVLVISQVSTHLVFAFLPATMVYSHALVVFANSSICFFAILQSRVHEVWTRFFGSSMKDDLRYTPSDCFETFPFPLGWETNAALESAGDAYYTFRAALMVRNDQGLTATYNRFHDPEEIDADILRLRELHAAMDRAVLDAYGWIDVPVTCEFLLDYEEEESSNRRKPWRYRWPEDVHDDVLARLLARNQGGNV